MSFFVLAFVKNGSYSCAHSLSEWKMSLTHMEKFFSGNDLQNINKIKKYNCGNTNKCRLIEFN